jgi:hypothetical protein
MSSVEERIGVDAEEVRRHSGLTAQSIGAASSERRASGIGVT